MERRPPEGVRHTAGMRRGTLVPILDSYRMFELNLYAVYLSHRFLPSKVRGFIDFLVDALGTGEQT